MGSCICTHPSLYVYVLTPPSLSLSLSLSTPLMLAAKDNCSSIVSCLLEAPLIDIDVKDFTGKTASDYSQPDSKLVLYAVICDSLLLLFLSLSVLL